MRKLFLILITALTVVSCRSSKPEGMPLTGGDRDRHGCIASAGYTWSQVRRDCIRVFEEGVRLVPAHVKTSVAAYVVFSPDHSRAELFLPGKKEHPVLKRKGGIWKKKSYILVSDKGRWVLKTGGTDVYVSPQNISPQR